MDLKQKYKALLQEAHQRKLPDIDGIQLCFQMLSLASNIDQDCADQLAAFNLSEGRFVLLFLLDAAGEGVAPKDLAEKAGVTRATVTGLLDGLVREAYIERQVDPKDRRALKIQLTAKGKSIAQRVFAQHSRWISGIFAHLNSDERQQLTQLLKKVSNNLTHKE